MSASCELLEWDSSFFGVRIARVIGERLDDAQAAAALAWCGEHDVSCLYFLAAGDDAATAEAAHEHGFELVDERVELRRAVRGPADARAATRPATTADLEALVPIARTSFTTTRFFFDPRFPHERCEALYEEWLVGSVGGRLADAVLVAELDGSAAGFVTCRQGGEPGTGEIGLLAAGAQAHGRGLGDALTGDALRWFADQGMRQAAVATQGRNAASQRLYERHGFVADRVRLWFHRWFT